MSRSQRPVWLGDDRRQWDHVRVHLAVLRDDRLGAYELAAYLGLAAHAETNSGEAHPSIATLASYAKCSTNRMRDSIQVLVEAGYVAVDAQAGASNRYRLLPPPLHHAEGSTEPTPASGEGDPSTTRSTTPPPGEAELEPGEREPEDESSSSPTAPSKRGTRLPEPFILNGEMRAWAAETVPEVDVRDQTQRFVDYWRAQPGQRGVKLDWLATWRNWMRNARDRAPRHRADRQTDARRALIADLRGKMDAI